MPLLIDSAPNVQPEEAKYFLEVCDAVVITVPTTAQHGRFISDKTGVKSLTFDASPSPVPEATFVLDSTESINPDKGLLLLYTSGTTGPPKGVLHSRRSATLGSQDIADLFGVTPVDTWLHFSPVHWMGGIMTLMINMMTGSCTEFCGSRFSPDWLLERLQQGDSISLFLSPPSLSAVASKVQDLKHSESGTYHSAIKGLRSIRLLCSGSMAVSPSLQAVWQEIRNKPVAVAYGMTEAMGFLSGKDWRGKVDHPLNSCGGRRGHAILKVDDKGEICAKTPTLFKRYLSRNPKVMDGVFDSEGFYKTGDVGKLENDVLYVHGRISQDVIRFSGWKLYAPEVEAEICNHPEISQAIVVGVADPEAGQRVAALISQNADCQSAMHLANLRLWLAVDRGMYQYKLPTLLRTVGPRERIPLTASNKPVKGKVRDVFFNESEISSGRVEVWVLAAAEDFGNRPFDWGGIS